MTKMLENCYTKTLPIKDEVKLYNLGYLKFGSYLQEHTQDRRHNDQPDNIVHKNFGSLSMH
jgi:hypothetical protein